MKNLLRRAAGAAAALVAAVGTAAGEADHAAARDGMVRDIIATYRESGTGAPDPRVLEAMRRVLRHEFVPPVLVPFAYANRPLPIGEEQTISQPYIVAFMTDLARVRKGDRVLEVGTGSGYQAAVLAEMGATVHTIEILPRLAASARDRLVRLGYRDVHVVTGDGYEGIEAQAPFDSILVTAGAPHVPPALVRQLRPGGRMVIPVGEAGSVQHLTVVEKNSDGAVTKRTVLPVRFVPLTR
jgi:protein-L-isoaspartate(D-aspartate) O-methyltransferase